MFFATYSASAGAPLDICGKTAFEKAEFAAGNACDLPARACPAVRKMQCLLATVLIHYKRKPDEEGEPAIRPHEPLNSLRLSTTNSLSCR